MKTRILFIFTLLLGTSTMYAQYNEIACGRAPSTSQILQIDFTEISTLVFIKYTNNGNGWISIGDKTHLKDVMSDKDYYMLNAINIPLSDEGEPKELILDRKDQVHYFCLEFEKLPDTIEKFNLIEDEANPNAFNFYDITIHKEKKTAFIRIDDFIKSYPIKEYGYRTKDGNLIFYYKHKGFVIFMTIIRDDKYGDYYQAWIDIQNFTGKNLLLDPNRITAKALLRKKEGPSPPLPPFRRPTKSVNGEKEEIKVLEILSYEEYMKKVNRRQAWQSFAVSLSNSLAASNAGYSSSTTNTSVSGVTNSYGSASGYVGDTYGYVSGRSSSYSTAYGRSSTQSYNGAAAYAAQQNANAQTNNYIAAQYEIKNRLSEGYIKANTLSNQTEYMGFFNIRFIKTDNLTIEIPINGETYIFKQEWTNN